MGREACLAALCDVGRDDDGHDAALGRADDSSLRRRRPAKHAGQCRGACVCVTAGYLAAWALFAAAAVLLQRLLSEALLLTPMMQLSSNRAASAVLALAGLYQLTPLKRTCLASCQSPAAFIARHWRDGLAGAFRMGATHGLFCLGCCWALMLLLFAGGVMHLTTIGLLTVFVLLEKVLPLGAGTRWFTWATGTVLLGLAAWVLD
jgi:predicted metal-binding membrane protein